jgi:hypothetical protein
LLGWIAILRLTPNNTGIRWTPARCFMSFIWVLFVRYPSSL